MAFLFNRSRARSAQDLVKSSKDLLQRLGREEGQAAAAKTQTELSSTIATLKVSLCGTPDTPTPDASSQSSLISAILSEKLLPLLVSNLHLLPFETRKDTQTLIAAVFRYRAPGSTANEPDALREVIRTAPEVIVQLCRGYERKESASACGGVLKEALKWDAVAAVILYDESVSGDSGNGPTKTVDIYNDIDTSSPSSGTGVFWSFFTYISSSPFEISADAFDTFRTILTKHKPLVAQYMGTNFERFFERYNNVLVRSESYVTKRQSLKLLGEVLLDRAFYEVMTRYVGSGENLKLVMWQLKDDRRMVQYEGFHVFKIFAANPNKTPEVQKFLIMNKQRLLKFLPRFLEERTDDDQFNDEKAWLIKAIGALPDDVGAAGAGSRQGVEKNPSTAQVRS
ncbi:hypothetical protein B0A48_03362 [Cryoendolithus antarcticus]|uniref:Conidiophore development protein hymA n=1 Tax=Cryoendolithus antarcticus TaxID=1507870 RepID=A0A1V8TJS8_9PEZI|nr:hypothetical protein B0A48_03362 [Cryoendolithus antarcticus]